MDDLISRAALLHSLNEQAPKPTTDDLYTVNLCIINAPAVDAVPVEWLQDKVIENGGQAEPHFAFMYVLHEWQKEQEAR